MSLLVADDCYHYRRQSDHQSRLLAPPPYPDQYSYRRVLLGRAAAVALRLLLLPFLSAEALGGARLSAGDPTGWTPSAHQDRPLAAERPGASALAEVERKPAIPVVSPAVDFGAAGMVGCAHYDVSVLGTLSAAARASRHNVSRSAFRDLAGRCATSLPARGGHPAWR